MNLKDLIEKRAKVWETAKNFVDTHENENGVLSAEDTATYNRMEQDACTSSFADLSAALEAAGAEKNLSIRIQREDIFNAMHRI